MIYPFLKEPISITQQQWKNSPPPLVSLFCNTYNHELFIQKALESFLMQRTTFRIEILVHDDASTDTTAEIIRIYSKKYPDIIFPIFQKENQFKKGNKIIGRIQRDRAKGKYAAVCEGDDYWTDPLKLQKQIVFLENNHDYVISFHNVKIWDEAMQKLVDDYITRDVAETTDIYDLAKGNYIHTPSVVYRRELFSDYPKQYLQSPVGDYFIHMLNARFGKIKKHDDCMAVYRVHSGGIWSTKHKKERIIHYLDLMIDYFEDPQIKFSLIKRRARILKSGKLINKAKRFVKNKLYGLFNRCYP